MTETRLQAVRRRWHNITNAIRGIDVYVDEHGTRYVDYALTAEEARIAIWALRSVRDYEGGPGSPRFVGDAHALADRLEGTP